MKKNQKQEFQDSYLPFDAFDFLGQGTKTGKNALLKERKNGKRKGKRSSDFL
ncbi:MAG: hypothetical protein MRY57_02485 [Candidatus Pacebacteria bacterium]|nr:hypothetical protein [Candidatus Paceibacterota bacterium]